MDKNRDEIEDIIYAINVEQQKRIYDLLVALNIIPRKRQNINFVKIKTSIHYFDSSTSHNTDYDFGSKKEPQPKGKDATHPSHNQ